MSDQPVPVPPASTAPVAADDSRSWLSRFGHGCFSGFGCLVYLFGFVLLFAGIDRRGDVTTAIALMTTAVLFVAVEQSNRMARDPFVHPREKLGVAAYLLGFSILVFKHRLFFPAMAFTFGWFLVGFEPIKRLVRYARDRLLGIDVDRWVNWFGNLLIISAVIWAILMFLAYGKPFSFDLAGEKFVTEMRGLAFIVSAAIVVAMAALGFGIRRRALWAGILGLCLTFWGFLNGIMKVLVSTRGDLRLCPEAILGYFPELLLSWCFFFGFYAVFSPLVASRAKGLTSVLEGKLKAVDEALNTARQELNHAETRAARTARDLEEERIKFRAMFEGINEGIILCDADEKILYANPAFCSLYQFDRESWSGKPWAEAWKRPGFEFLPAPIPESGKLGTGGTGSPGSGPSPRGEIVWRDDRGSVRRRIAFYFKDVVDASGAFLARMGLSRDVTLEREIDRMKTEFVSNVSHELRTPLTSIRAYTEMLLDGEVEDAQTRGEYLKIILDESERLTNLINDVLDLSKMEAGKKVYKFADHDPVAVARKVFSICQSAAEAKGLELSCDLPPVGTLAHFDQDLLHQAILNLVNNGIKYTASGGFVKITLRWEGDPEPERYLVEVSDNGQGISVEDQKKLFNKFFRVESTLTQDAGGTGLGLALVKQIITVHQGEVGVRSELGKGSTFFFVLPRKMGTP